MPLNRLTFLDHMIQWLDSKTIKLVVFCHFKYLGNKSQKIMKKIKTFTCLLLANPSSTFAVKMLDW